LKDKIDSNDWNKKIKKKDWENKKDQNNKGQILKKLNWIKFNGCNWNFFFKK